MRLTVVDAFTDRPFSGNPAAVATPDSFPDEARMQAIAAEMNLSETAFAVARPDGDYDLRWFTPTTEVSLCGHATLATAHVIGEKVGFHTKSGKLSCSVSNGLVEMDFPVWTPEPTELPFLPSGIPEPAWAGIAGEDWLLELPRPDDVVNLVPDIAGIAALGRRTLIVTARSDDGAGCDVVSRVFGPSVGVAEDPVTGSAHCALAAYWAPKLGRDELVGFQASRRGGTVRMRLDGDRVVLGGAAVTVSEVDLLV